MGPYVSKPSCAHFLLLARWKFKMWTLRAVKRHHLVKVEVCSSSLLAHSGMVFPSIMPQPSAPWCSWSFHCHKSKCALGLTKLTIQAARAQGETFALCSKPNSLAWRLPWLASHSGSNNCWLSLFQTWPYQTQRPHMSRRDSQPTWLALWRVDKRASHSESSGPFSLQLGYSFLFFLGRLVTFQLLLAVLLHLQSVKVARAREICSAFSFLLLFAFLPKIFTNFGLAQGRLLAQAFHRLQ